MWGYNNGNSNALSKIIGAANGITSNITDTVRSNRDKQEETKRLEIDSKKYTTNMILVISVLALLTFVFVFKIKK